MKKEEFDLNSPFKYFVKLQKSFTGDDGVKYIQGVASGTQIDRQGEKMSPEVLQAFVQGLPLPLTDNHEHGNVGTELGEVVDAHIQDDGNMFIKAKLDSDNPFSDYLIKKVEQGKKFAFSIEGKIKRATKIFDRSLGTFIKEYQEVIPEAISVTTCPVYEPSFLEVVSKSFADSQQNNIINKLSNNNADMKKAEVKESEKDMELEDAMKSFSGKEVKDTGDKLGINWEEITPEEFFLGMNHELEHGTKNPETNVTNDDPIETGKIALEHLKEDPKYYSKLFEIEPEEVKEEKEEEKEAEKEMEKSDPEEEEKEAEMEKDELIEETQEMIEEIDEVKEEAHEAMESVEDVCGSVEDVESAAVDLIEATQEVVEATEDAHEEEDVEVQPQETNLMEESKKPAVAGGSEEESDGTQETSEISELRGMIKALSDKVDSLMEARVQKSEPESPLELVVKSLTDKVEHLESLPLMKKTLARPTIQKSEGADVAPKTVRDVVSSFI